MVAESMHDPGRTRTCNLWFRRPTPYPLGHRAWCSQAMASHQLGQLAVLFNCKLPYTHYKLDLGSQQRQTRPIHLARIELATFSVLG